MEMSRPPPLRAAGARSVQRSEFVLATMAAAGPRASFDPVQVQKALFLADRGVGREAGGPHFDFRPAAYGPFDPAVFEALGQLAAEGRASLDGSGPCPAYAATGSGRDDGRAALGRMPRRAARYLRKASRWVLAQPFWDLVAGIQRAYPEMVLDGGKLRAAMPGPDPARERRLHPLLAGMAGAVSFPGRLGRLGLPQRGSDAAAIASDWRAVGDDLRHAMERWAAEQA